MMREYPQSKALYERPRRVLAGGVASEFRKLNAPHPLFYTRGQGSRLWDADGNGYLDFTSRLELEIARRLASLADAEGESR
jgi:glutamate-1-semialdehyde 2,1-aminomutase